MITQAELKKYITYNPETGIFVRLANKLKKFNNPKIAGYKKEGYIAIKVNGIAYMAHRLAWLYVYGNMPKDQIDHINGIKIDNRISNLRECTNSENHQNRQPYKNTTSKYTGVTWHKKQKKWNARIKINQEIINLGSFSDEIEAYQAYCKAKSKIHTFNPIQRLS